MKAGKILGLVVGGFVTLGALALLSVWLVVDPNAYKPKIEAAVKQATGRELLLQGDMRLSVLPWIALQVGPARLRNLPGFGDQPLLTFKHAACRVRLLPLLAKRLEIGRVEIDGLDARLVRNADGRGNWERAGTAAGPVAAAANEAEARRVFAGIGAIKLTHARVSYGRYTVENLNVETGAFMEGVLAPVTITFDANRGVPTEHASVDARLDFSADFGTRRYQAAALTFHATLNRSDNPRQVRGTFATPVLDLDLEAQTLIAPVSTLDVGGAHLSGSLLGKQIVDAPNLSGQVTLSPLIVREFMPRVGMTAPRTRDPRALSLVSGSFNYGYGGDGAHLDDLQLTLDTSHVTGSASIVERATPAVKFALAVDTIDLDRYLPPAGAGGAADGGAGAAGDGSRSAAEDVNGSLSVGSLHLAPLDLTQVAVTVAATRGVVHLFPLTAQVDGGQYSGNIVLDRHEPVSVLTLDEHLTGIEVGRLAGTPGNAVHLSGRGSVTLKATGRGANADALLRTLDGHLDAVVDHGAVEGVDVGYQLDRAEALLRRQDAPDLKDMRRTTFDAMTLSADIVDGVAQTRDLTISSPALRVTGQGSVNLPTQAVDFSLLAGTLRKAGNTPFQIPLTVTGSMADPTVRPDLEALARGQLRHKVPDPLQGKLKGLFNR